MRKSLPSNLKDALFKSMEIAGLSIEGAEYFAERFENLLVTTKTKEKFSDLLQRVQDFAKYTVFKLRSRDEPWFGQVTESSDYKNMQAEMALDAARNIRDMHLGTTAPTVFEFAINNASELLRGYSEKGRSLEADTLKSMDTLFNAYLAENNIKSQGSVLYETTDKGQVKLDTQGKPMRVDSEKIRELLNDSEKGYARYAEKKGISLTCHEQQYPSAQKDMQAKTTIKEALTAAEQIEAEATQAEIKM